MSTQRGKSPAGGKPQQQRQQQSRQPQRRFPVIPVVIGGVVLLAVIAIVITAVGGKSSSTKDNRPNLEQNRPVSVAGNPLSQFATTQNDPAVGTAAPTVQGQAFDGTPITIGNDGTPKIVLFVAHWCPHCQKEVPLISQWLRTHQVPAGVQLVTVSTGVSEQAPNFPPSAWLQREEWRVPTIADDAKGTAAKAFGLTGYPYFVAIDKTGKVLERASGELTISDWEALLAKTAGQPATGQ